MGTDWCCGTTSCSRSLYFARRRRRVRHQDASRVSPRPACDAGGRAATGTPTQRAGAHVVFDCTATWTLLGVRVSLGRGPRRRRRGWMAFAAGGIEWPRGHDKVCVCRWPCSRGGGGGTGENGLKVGGQGQLRLILCVHRAFRNGGSSVDVSRRRGRRLQGCPPLE
jgi:hypothetical protein